MGEPLYYAKGAMVFKRPVERQREDGSTATSLGFPVCTVSEFLGEEGATILAAMLNKADDDHA